MSSQATTIRLGSLCDLISAQVSPNQVRPDAHYLGLEHLASGRMRAIGYGKAADVQSHKFAFKRNDVLYGKLRPYLDKSVLADQDGICTTELLVLRAKPKVRPDFLACVVHAQEFIEHAMTGVTGAHHPRTSWSHISNFEAPQLDETQQAKFATALWTIHDLLNACEESEETLASLKDVAMRELFTRRAMPENEHGPQVERFPLERLDQCASVISTRMSYSEFQAITFVKDEGVEVLGIKVSDMNRDGNETDLVSASTARTIEARIAKTRCAPPGTIVFPKRGAAIATNKKRMTTTWTVFDPNVIGVRPGPRINSRYLFHWFQHFDLRTITEPGPTPQLNKKHLDPLLIPIPKEQKEQDEIAEILDAIDRKINLHRRKRAVLQELFRTLLHKLMTGEIDVDDLDLSTLSAANA